MANIETIEKEIQALVQEKIKNMSREEARKLIEQEVVRKQYLTEEWQIQNSVDRISQGLKDGIKQDIRKAKSLKFSSFDLGILCGGVLISILMTPSVLFSLIEQNWAEFLGNAFWLFLGGIAVKSKLDKLKRTRSVKRGG